MIKLFFCHSGKQTKIQNRCEQIILDPLILKALIIISPRVIIKAIIIIFIFLRLEEERERKKEDVDSEKGDRGGREREARENSGNIILGRMIFAAAKGACKPNWMGSAPEKQTSSQNH